jgi:hypothetical protein
MNAPQNVAQAAKHTGINLALTVGICVIIAVGYMAYDSNFFTKPLSWWRIGLNSTDQVLKDY